MTHNRETGQLLYGSWHEGDQSAESIGADEDLLGALDVLPDCDLPASLDVVTTHLVLNGALQDVVVMVNVVAWYSAIDAFEDCATLVVMTVVGTPP